MHVASLFYFVGLFSFYIINVSIIAAVAAFRAYK